MATGYQEIDGTGYYLNNGKQSTKTVHDSSDGVYYVIEKGSHAVTDIVEESEWWAYKKDADRNSADLSNVVMTDGTEQKTGTTGSLQKLTDAGIYEDWAMACFELINQERKKKELQSWNTMRRSRRHVISARRRSKNPIPIRGQMEPAALPCSRKWELEMDPWERTFMKVR